MFGAKATDTSKLKYDACDYLIFGQQDWRQGLVWNHLLDQCRAVKKEKKIKVRILSWNGIRG